VPLNLEESIPRGQKKKRRKRKDGEKKDYQNTLPAPLFDGLSRNPENFRGKKV